MSPEKRLEMFYRKTIPEPNSGCLLWLGAQHKGGYGKITLLGATVLAHRFAWTAEHGPPPSHLDVLHRCDTPACVNIDHLFLGSRADNNLDMRVKGRQAAKLTADQVRDVLRSGDGPTLLGRRLGVDRKTIARIRNRTAWTWVRE